MKHWRALLFLLALLALAPGARAAEDGVRAVIVYEEDADPAALTAAVEALEGVELLWRYGSLFPGAAVEADEAALAALESLEGVAGVGLAQTHALPQSKDADPAESDGGLALMNAGASAEDGDGVVIAVLDSGLRTDHEAFADYGLTKRPALTRADVEAFAANGGTAGRYLSAKVPFAYDYYGKDGDVSTSDGHGSHVTALAAGYVPGAGDEPLFSGTAPAAQIISMKVFPDGSTGGADDAVILRALEDAWNLGADVVNLSLGTGGGFSQDDVLGGLYSRAFAQMRASGVIICCAAGNSGTASAAKKWGEPLPTAAYGDYGSVCSPGSYIGSYSIAAAGLAEGQPEAADYSSWGTTPDLRLVPALTAFGGPATSAGSKGSSAYISETGTSMASGSAAGAFAVALQAARQRGVTDRTAAADLAAAMLMGSARLLEEDGTPVSPRKQGAGLVDLAAAASQELVVMTPLAELGDSQEGRFTIPLVLRNLSKSAMTVSLETAVLTDDYELHDGVYYRSLAPLDITGEVTVSGGGRVSVPAGGERTVTLTLTVGQKLRERLAAVYPYGFFVEGFVTASAGDQAAHSTFLGFCGDWSAAPILDPTDHRVVQEAMFRLGSRGGQLKEDAYLAAVPVELGANRPYIGREDDQGENPHYLAENPRAYALPGDERGTLPVRGTEAMFSAGDTLYVELYTLRNAAHVVMLVTDQRTGEAYYVDDQAWMAKSEQDPYTKGIGPSGRFSWDGADADGQPLPAGTQVRVDFYAWLDWDKEMEAVYGQSGSDYGAPETYRWLLSEEYAPYREWSFPVTIDGAAPSVNVSGEAGNLTVTFQDDLHLAYAAVWDSGGRLLSEKRLTPQTAGESVSVTVDVSGAEAVYVAAEDYASNAVGYVYDLETLSAAECPAAILTDVSKGAWYHEAVDYVRAKDLMAGETPFTFQPQDSATRAQVVSALYAAAGSPSTSFSAGDLPFTDISAETPYLPALTWAYGQGIVDGYNENTFGGMASVTRQQLAVMLRRCAQLYGTVDPAGDLSGFADRSSVADWARDGLSWAVGEGLIAGRSSDALDPQGLTTRAELAQIVMRFVEG
mgnify:CR=1 FL=1